MGMDTLAVLVALAVGIVGLATTVRDPRTSSAMGQSLRSRGSVELAPWADGMPMPLPGTLKVRVGGGMVDRRKLKRMSDMGGGAAAAMGRSLAGSSGSAKDRVTRTLRPVKGRG